MYKQLNLEPPNLRLYQTTRNIAGDIASNIYSALKDLGVIFEIYIQSSSTELAGAYPASSLDSYYGTHN